MNEILEILKSVGGLITDSHIIGTSGKHLDAYINKDALYPHTQKTSLICEKLAQILKDLEVDVVVSPALGGIVLSQWVAFHLSNMKNREIFAVYAEKTPEKNMVFTRGYDRYISGKRILVVEDVFNTGGSAKKTVEAVKAAGGEVAAVAGLVNRNPETVNSGFFGVPLHVLCEFKLSAFEEMDCPMCRSGIPINTEVGHGKKYLESKKQAGAAHQ